METSLLLSGASESTNAISTLFRIRNLKSYTPKTVSKGQFIMREDSYASVARSLEIMRPCPCPKGHAQWDTFQTLARLGSHNCMPPGIRIGKFGVPCFHEFAAASILWNFACRINQSARLLSFFDLNEYKSVMCVIFTSLLARTNWKSKRVQALFRRRFSHFLKRLTLATQISLIRPKVSYRLTRKDLKETWKRLKLMAAPPLSFCRHPETASVAVLSRIVCHPKSTLENVFCRANRGELLFTFSQN